MPAWVERTVWPCGAVHAVVAEDFSPQYDTTQPPPAGTCTSGVVCSARVTVSDALACAATTPRSTPR
ncbi:hypothetical protein PS9374_07228 [Planomonospora sphaerica]|uniref:Uncharacterized protein n=1 Tax=Planomonospora sphaerica TaxID=161355 RepID=A0A171DR60_9ACTN|nr:hypothetical protein PS9374_07228 [Planomonospora sphaerica]